MTEEWANALNDIPFKSSKLISMVLICVAYIIESNGKMLHLLKHGSKKIKKKHERKQYAIVGSLSDYKREMAEYESQ